MNLNIKKIRNSSLLLMMSIGIFSSSCKKEESSMIGQESNQIIQTESDQFVVSKSEARDLALRLSFPNLIKHDDGIEIDKNSIISKQIASIESVNDHSGKPVFHIVNYEVGGFVLISGDKRAEPIQAYSYENTFEKPTTDDSRLYGWMNESIGNAELVRNALPKKGAHLSEDWGICSVQDLISDFGAGASACGMQKDEHGCDNAERYREEIRFKVQWSQTKDEVKGSYFNRDAPDMGCSKTGNERAYMGCGPIAMGMVMKYHGETGRYNSSSMKDTYATRESSRFLRRLADDLDADFSCSGTSVKNDDMEDVFHDYDYDADFRSFSWSKLKSDIKDDLPVLLVGTKSDEKSGHVWVCSGYKKMKKCNSRSNRYQLKMHWGWKAKSDGWFLRDCWKTNSGTEFNSIRRMIYNIEPN